MINANGQVNKSRGEGQVRVLLGGKEVVVSQVQYGPDLKYNILSYALLRDKGVRFDLNEAGADSWAYLPSGSAIPIERVGRHYRVSLKSISQVASADVMTVSEVQCGSWVEQIFGSQLGSC